MVSPDDLHADVEFNTEQSQRLLRLTVVTISLAGMWLIWGDVLPALRILDRWQLWATTVDVSADSIGMGGPSPIPSMKLGGQRPLPKADHQR